MGYRYHLQKISKETTKKLQACKNISDFKTLLSYLAPDRDEYYMFNIGKEIFTFGSWNPGEKFLSTTSALSIDEILEDYRSCDALLLSDESLRCIIDDFRQEIIEDYKSLPTEEVNSLEEAKEQLNKFKFFVHEKLRIWDCPFVTVHNMNEESDCIVRAGDTEHWILELVRIYKTFDWKNYDLVLLRW